jgi:predicted transcriptional regulator
MRFRSRNLGDQELALLTYVSDHGSVTAGEAMGGFGEVNGLARSTVETVLGRLHKKGFLLRKKEDGVFRYSPAQAPQEVMGGLVERFVEQTLGGSLAPLVTYFSRQGHLSKGEMDELRRLVQKLQDGETGSE